MSSTGIYLLFTGTKNTVHVCKCISIHQTVDTDVQVINEETVNFRCLETYLHLCSLM